MNPLTRPPDLDGNETQPMTTREGLPGKLAWSEIDPDEALHATAAAELAAEDGRAADRDEWPAVLWATLRRIGAPRWTIPEEFGGAACPRPLLVQRYARLAGGSLTAMFILSQHDAAIRRLLAAGGSPVAEQWLCAIARGDALATVGISHLTTSKRLGTQAIRGFPAGSGRYRLDGTMPWVTGAPKADVVVTGGVLDDGRQILVALATDRPGVTVCPPFPLAALQASCTSEIRLDGVEVEESDVLAGPSDQVLAHPGAVGTGGLETSVLAAGQARAALAALVELAPGRDELAEPLDALCDDWQSLWTQIMAQARGVAGAMDPSRIRGRANGLVTRATQAYLTARKGTGFLRTEPAQRWARQALFFLVWSCPAPVAQAAIRDLAGLCPSLD
ncbi:MAG: acyl-CoA dehydrogenase family protein [Isosphaeraceae bacterium]